MKHSSTLTDFTFSETFPFTIDEESYSKFLEKACSTSTLQWVIVSFSCHSSNILRWFSNIKKYSSSYFYWEKPAASQVLAAVGQVHTINRERTHRFEAVHRSIEEFKSKSLHINISTGQKPCDTHLVGGFSFYEDLQQNSSWNGFKSTTFKVPEFTVKQHGNQITASLAVATNNLQRPESLHKFISEKISKFYLASHSNGYPLGYNANSDKKCRSIQSKRNSYKKWVQLIGDAKQTIIRGPLKKVVMGRQLNLEVSPNYSPLATVHNLRSQYPNCSTFLVKNKNSSTFIGCSPEQLLSVKDNRLRTEALAGSIARGTTEKQDQKWATELMNSFKDHEEHTYVVNDIKRLLQPFVKSIRSNRQPVIKKFANVQHLYSPIQATLGKDENTPLSILSKLHPTPAVGGTPRESALQYIRDHEPFNRGWFASPVGWITTGGDAEFTVAIRSGLINDSTALLFAGCGIVADSNPEKEWQETNLKFIPMLSALNYD